MKKKIMFVCHGNICRSPMAEFIFKKMVEEAGLGIQFEICSSATSTEEIWNGKGNPVYPPAREELARHGISCKGKCAVQLTRYDYAEQDMLIAMDSYNLRNMRPIVGNDTENKIWKLLDFGPLSENADIEPIHFSGRDISDPWYTGDFRQTYQDIVEGCTGLLNWLSRK